RMQTAPIRASALLLANQPSTIVKGTPFCNSAARCAGSAAASSTHHEDAGVRSSAASSREFGSQRVEIGWGSEVNANPSWALREEVAATQNAWRQVSACTPASLFPIASRHGPDGTACEPVRVV